jgi:hypothetical protein
MFIYSAKSFLRRRSNMGYLAKYVSAFSSNEEVVFYCMKYFLDKQQRYVS